VFKGAKPLLLYGTHLPGESAKKFRALAGKLLTLDIR
jgi:hypothetical protein